QEDARQLAHTIFSLPQRPTAIFAAIDTLAFGVLAAAQDIGLRVPDDVGVIGFDDIQAASYMRLTTINQQLLTSGRMGAQLMLDWLKDGIYPEERHRIQLPLEVVQRATTKAYYSDTSLFPSSD
ncbi:MAG: substrate-binding domain-containing protein, partial [Chloroflexi bacterium]|nr:substrate-binding domain-containing protein [Chloroflexota bacterium]